MDTLSLPFLFMAAPMQGLTTARWRSAHASLAGEAQVGYFTPFVRMERGKVRRHDLRDVEADTVGAVPQVICGSGAELRELTGALADMGHTRIDINMGCPFPPQVRRGRGAGLMLSAEALAGVAAEVTRRHDVAYSLKMRPGVTGLSQWRQAIDAVNDMPLAHVTLHARTASAGYGGDIDHACIDEFAAACRHPVVANGDMLAPADVTAMTQRHPALAGVMVGRGLLTRPSLAAEVAGGCEWPLSRRLALAVEVHLSVARSYGQGCADGRVALSALALVLPYLLEGAASASESGRRAFHRALKAARKSRTLGGYIEALEAALTVARGIDLL